MLQVIDPQELLINGELNDILDEDIRPINDEGDWGRRDKNQLKGGSTHVSVMHKSPLDAYTDQSDCRHAFTCQPSQRSSFDDSFSETLNPFLSFNGTAFNPTSVSFVGEGLCKPD